MTQAAPDGSVVNPKNLPPDFPTHLHGATFWEELGRTVATFGFLEETLGRAIFALTATREMPDNKLQEEYEKWIPTLEKALSDPLGPLINSFGKAVRANSASGLANLDDLLDDLREASFVRNVLCHGSWKVPDNQGKSVPHFVDKKLRVFQTPVDVSFLQQVRRHVTVLVCATINTVTSMGWQFPGSKGPGTPIL